MIRAFATIIVEGADDCWSAWFRDVPQVAIGAEWPAEAIQRLLSHFGDEDFDGEEIVVVDEDTREGHHEFLVPLRGRSRIPTPSIN